MSNIVRARSTKRDGSSFSHEDKSAVWRKGQPIPGKDPNEYRKDCCGATMYWIAYGNVNSNIGWEVDHIVPVANSGSDDISNLQPLQWQNNRSKGDNSQSSAYCVVTS